MHVYLTSLLYPQEDAECPLCLEEMDISDLNFKPCPCGYQVRISVSVSCPAVYKRISAGLPILLASHQGEPQQPLPCVSEGVH